MPEGLCCQESFIRAGPDTEIQVVRFSPFYPPMLTHFCREPSPRHHIALIYRSLQTCHVSDSVGDIFTSMISSGEAWFKTKSAFLKARLMDQRGGLAETNGLLGAGPQLWEGLAVSFV